MYSQVNSFDEALMDLDFAIKLDPTNSDYLHWRGARNDLNSISLSQVGYIESDKSAKKA